MFTTILPFDTGVQYCNSACLHGQYPSPYADLPKNCLSKCKGFLVAVYFPMQQRQPEKEFTWNRSLKRRGRLVPSQLELMTTLITNFYNTGGHFVVPISVLYTVYKCSKKAYQSH